MFVWQHLLVANWYPPVLFEFLLLSIKLIFNEHTHAHTHMNLFVCLFAKYSDKRVLNGGGYIVWDYDVYSLKINFYCSKP